MGLKAHQQVVISRADSARVIREFTGLARNWKKGRWLGVTNRYARNCIQKINRDTGLGGHLRHGHLASYIAASSVIHCMDGWSYVARAMEAELSGDIDVARHLAYYAELRAAMSLLAGVGVGVFNTKHFALNENRICERIVGSGTHEFVWDALEYWAQQPAAATLILSVIRPGGRELSEWLQHFPPTASGAYRAVLAKQWLLDWGLDLRQLALDRAARNESSYRPTNITPRRRPTLNQSLNFVEHLWRANEPSGSNPFKVIDRYLLRRNLASAFKVNHARNLTPQRAPANFKRLVEPVLHALLPTPGDFTDIQWRQFLNFRRPAAGNQIISQAEKRDPISSPLHHIQVIARATILLRVATGATRDILKSLSAGDVEHLSFWWRPIGETKGLWEVGAPPTQFTDLWQDVELSLDRLQAWRNAGGNSKKGLFGSAAEAARSLSSCERVALWSLGL